MRKIFIIILTLINCTTIASQDSQVFSKGNITFEYPSEWIIRDLTDSYALVSEPPTDQSAVLTTFDITVDSYSGKLSHFCQEYEQQIIENEQFYNFKIKSKKKGKFKTFRSIEYKCSATIMDLPFEWKSVIFIHKEKVYKLSTTSLTKQLHAILETTERIFNSFEIDDDYEKAYEYAISGLAKDGMECSYYFQYSISKKNVPLDQPEIDAINNSIRKAFREEMDRYSLVEIINNADNAESIIEKTLREQNKLLNLRVSHIGVPEIMEKYLQKLEINLDKIKLDNFDDVNHLEY